MTTVRGWDADRHLQLLTTLHWVIAGAYGLAFLFTSLYEQVTGTWEWFPLLIPAGLHAAAAMGLPDRQPWGRVVSFIAAIISLFPFFPLGIAFLVYTIVVHVRPDVKEQFTGAPA